MQLTDNNDCNGNVGCEIAETEVEGMSYPWPALDSSAYLLVDRS